MTISMTQLLVQSDLVPPAARDALRHALAEPPDAQRPHLETAARILHRDVGLDCAQARALVGLPGGGC